MDEINCLNCEYYDAEDDRCRAFDCWLGVDCTAPLPCEENDDANVITTLQKDSYVLEVELEEKINNIIIIPYDDYNSRIPKDTTCIGTITSTIGHSALRNGWKIIEISNK